RYSRYKQSGTAGWRIRDAVSVRYPVRVPESDSVERTMSTNDSDQLDALWERIDQEAAEAKFSHQAVIELSRLYRGWDAEEQGVARRAFAAWLNSSNARKRFDALAL